MTSHPCYRNTIPMTKDFVMQQAATNIQLKQQFSGLGAKPIFMAYKIMRSLSQYIQ